MVLDAPSLENPPARILIIDTAWLGDVIFTTSLMGAVKRLWPESELHVMVAPRGVPLLGEHPHLDRVWVLNKRGTHRSLPAMRRFAGQLRQVRFDLILNAHPSFRSRLLTRWIGAPLRVGYEGLAASLCFTHRVPHDLAIEPDHVARRLALLKAIGVPASPAPLLVPVPSGAQAAAEHFLNQHAVLPPVLGLVPGSAWETKRWPEENFRELALRWIHERKGTVLLFGGAQEAELVETLHAAAPLQILPVINRPLPHVAALLRHCEAVVGNDTGVGLLAVAVSGPRVILLYGSTQINYHFPPPHLALTAGVPCCLPRTGHGAHRCQWSGTSDAWCMSQLSVNRVWAALHS